MPVDKKYPVIDWGKVQKHPIYDPAHLAFMERDDYLKSVCGVSSPTPRPLEEAVVSIWEDMGRGGVRCRVDVETLKMAQDYIRYRNQGARLPKFSKWTTGMFRDSPTLAADLAAAGKWEEKSSDVVISCELIDLLRNAATHHFSSCLKADGYYPNVVPKIIEECPGIGIAYVDDENGYMRGRCWIHHAQRVDDGTDCIIVCTKWGGTLSAEQVVDVLRAKGVQAYVGGSYGRQHEGRNAIAVNFVGCLTKSIHHDMHTWIKGFKVAP